MRWHPVSASGLSHADMMRIPTAQADPVDAYTGHGLATVAKQSTQQRWRAPIITKLQSLRGILRVQRGRRGMGRRNQHPTARPVNAVEAARPVQRLPIYTDSSASSTAGVFRERTNGPRVCEIEVRLREKGREGDHRRQHRHHHHPHLHPQQDRPLLHGAAARHHPPPAASRKANALQPVRSARFPHQLQRGSATANRGIGNCIPAPSRQLSEAGLH
jgi:hypothetical protein